MPTTTPPLLQNPIEGGGNLLNFFGRRTPYEFWLTCLIILLGIFIILVLVHSISKIVGSRSEDIWRPIIIVTIVTGTLVLVTAGYSNEQIAPAFGLFGTIIGYILGRMGQSNRTTKGEIGPGHEVDSFEKNQTVDGKETR
jgi:hypothetical protein